MESQPGFQYRIRPGRHYSFQFSFDDRQRAPPGYPHPDYYLGRASTVDASFAETGREAELHPACPVVKPGLPQPFQANTTASPVRKLGVSYTAGYTVPITCSCKGQLTSPDGEGLEIEKRPRHCRVRLRPLAVRPAMPPSLGGGGLSQLPPGRRAVDHARVGAAILVLCALPVERGRRGGAPHGRRNCCAAVHVGRVCVLHWNGGARVSAQSGIEAV